MARSQRFARFTPRASCFRSAIRAKPRGRDLLDFYSPHRATISRMSSTADFMASALG